jgi:hypothetical protein
MHRTLKPRRPLVVLALLVIGAISTACSPGRTTEPELNAGDRPLSDGIGWFGGGGRSDTTTTTTTSSSPEPGGDPTSVGG